MANIKLFLSKFIGEGEIECVLNYWTYKLSASRENLFTPTKIQKAKIKIEINEPNFDLYLYSLSNLKVVG
jgi:hypothetical protein